MNRVKNCVFLVRKWSYTTFNIVNIRKMWEKKGKIRRTRSMTKKKVIRKFTLKMEIFPEIGPRKNFLVPPKFGARSPPMKVSEVQPRCRSWGYLHVPTRRSEFGKFQEPKTRSCDCRRQEAPYDYGVWGAF